MKTLLITFATAAFTALLVGCIGAKPSPLVADSPFITLPTPTYNSQTSLETALLERRSVREYSAEPLTLAEISQLLWAAQGITHPSGLRTAPSAGALYPLEVYLLAANVVDLPAGIYHYRPQDHTLLLVAAGDQRQSLCQAALNQSAVQDAAAVIVIAAIYDRTTVKYGERGVRYVHMEAGSAAQNVYLQAQSLGIGTVFIGAFQDGEVAQIMHMSKDETPLGLMPVGRK